MPGNADPVDFSTWLRFMPEPKPSANMATRTAVSSATAGVPSKTRDICRLFWSLMVSSAIARRASRSPAG